MIEDVSHGNLRIRGWESQTPITAWTSTPTSTVFLHPPSLEMSCWWHGGYRSIDSISPLPPPWLPSPTGTQSLLLAPLAYPPRPMLDDVASRLFSNFQGLDQDSRPGLFWCAGVLEPSNPGPLDPSPCPLDSRGLEALRPSRRPDTGPRALRREPVLAWPPRPVHLLGWPLCPPTWPPMQSLTMASHSNTGRATPLPFPHPSSPFPTSSRAYNRSPSRPLADAARPTRSPSPVPRLRAHTQHA